MKIIIAPVFVKVITFNFASAITLWPFGIFLRFKEDADNHAVISHESIHWAQQKELPVLFYVWYLLEWVVKLFMYGKWAYWNLSFEREAYFNQNNMEYLEARKPYEWTAYL